MPTRSLTARLVLLLMLSFSVLMLALTAIEYFSSRQAILQDVETETRNTISAAANNLENRLNSIEETTKLLAEVIMHTEHSENDLLLLLEQAVDERTDIYGGAIALDPRWASDTRRGFAPYYYYSTPDPLGLALNYSNLAGDYNYTRKAWYREPRDQGTGIWTEPYMDTGGGNVLMATFAVPMYRSIKGRAEFYGVVTADLALRDIQNYVNSIELGSYGFGFLISRNARIMAHRDPETLLKPLLQIIPSEEDPSRWGKMVSAVSQGETASDRLPCRGTSGECLVTLTPLKSTGWPLGVYYSEYEKLTPLRQYLTRLIVSSIATVILLMLIVVLVSRRITLPLQSLAMASTNIAQGNFDTPLPKIRRPDEVGQLVGAFGTMQKELQAHIEELQRETAQRNRLEGELDAASEIQMAMLPNAGHSLLKSEFFQLWAHLRPARIVGGDFYNYARDDDGNLLIAIGDVSDKGVPAALFMARTMTLLQQPVEPRDSLQTLMEELNDTLTVRNENYMFVTLFVGRLNLATLQLEFCSAGHTPPSLIRPGQTALSLEQESGPALGLAPEQRFPLNQLQLQAGDVLALSTDGIEEAFNNEREQYGLNRFNASLQQNRGFPINGLGEVTIATVDQFAEPCPQSDDMALLLLRLHPNEFTYNILETRVSDALQWLRELLLQQHISEEVTGNAMLLAEEVITNIEKYSQLQAGSPIQISVTVESGGVILGICDSGIAFNPLVEAERASLGADSDSAEIGGLGVHLLEALSQRHHYRRTADLNVLQLQLWASNNTSD